jgi:hypothetical protein
MGWAGNAYVTRATEPLFVGGNDVSSPWAATPPLRASAPTALAAPQPQDICAHHT